MLRAELTIPPGAEGVVVFAHGSGSNRRSPRNQFVGSVIRGSGVGTLLCDLLTEEEESEDNITARLRFDIALLARRLVSVARWLAAQPATAHLGIGYFGASTGAGAALVAASRMGVEIDAVVSRGGRPDLAGDALPHVKSPTLLIVGGNDEEVMRLNEGAFAQLRCRKELRIVSGATHLFEEPGKIEEVALLAADWFCRHLRQHAAVAA